MTSALYFAYGSNMSPPRLQARVPSATPLGIARLDGHQLRFHKHSRVDGSAKCDACHTGADGHVVYGVIYRMAMEERGLLDRAEGLGKGYEIREVTVTSDTGERHEAFLYYATDIDPSLRPYNWYKHHVVYGARWAELPEPYIASIEAIPATADPDNIRHEREMALYRQDTPRPGAQ